MEYLQQSSAHRAHPADSLLPLQFGQLILSWHGREDSCDSLGPARPELASKGSGTRLQERLDGVLDVLLSDVLTSTN